VNTTTKREQTAATQACVEVLRRVMDETGTTQAELARRSGMQQSAISQSVNGKQSLGLNALSRLLDAMGYTLVLDAVPSGEGE